MSTLFERRLSFSGSKDPRDIIALCKALIVEKAEAGIFKLSASIFDRYEELTNEKRAYFFNFLNTELDIDAEAALKAAQAFATDTSPTNYQSLRQAAEAPRLTLFRKLNQIPGGTENLVRMRADLLPIKKAQPELSRTDQDLLFLLQAWFNRGFLVMRNITWNSPATLLEKIIKYEAVHKIHRWADLRARLQPDDRRCFAFFHPSMPEEPLIFVEVALTNEVPNSIDAVLSDERDPLDPMKATTAVFYSISNCQAGLAGVSFGNSLIKQVVRELSVDFPQLKTFVTLSPIPDFMRWAAESETAVDQSKPELLSAQVADYLLNAKRSGGLPYDPVARFHLGNGAQIMDVHANADGSEPAAAQSAGTMVNYHYDTNKIIDNQIAFENDQKISAAKKVRNLASAAKKSKLVA